MMQRIGPARQAIFTLRPMSIGIFIPNFSSFSTVSSLRGKPLPPRTKINEEDIIENFIKGGGAGGQKINKTNSLVQLIHRPTNIHIRCQATRSRSQNRTIGRRILAERIEELEKGDQSRTSIKEEKVRKKKASSIKKSRRKYKELGKDSRDSQEHTSDYDVTSDDTFDVSNAPQHDSTGNATKSDTEKG